MTWHVSKEIVLFLDIDGCLSPLPNHSDTWGDWQKYDRNGYPSPVANAPIYLSQKMADELAGLDVEIRWLSTWGLYGSFISQKLGWPLLSYTDPYIWPNDPWWKLNVVKAFEEVDDRPYIWVDDELRWRLPYVYDVLPQPTAGKPQRWQLISPQMDKGISPHHIECMRQFIEEKKT